MQGQTSKQEIIQPVEIAHAKKQPRYQSYWKVMLIAINLSLSNFYFGYGLVYISTVQFSLVMKVFNVSLSFQTARGILTGCISFGALFGALAGKKLIHWFSRRNFILFINAVAIVSGSLLFIPNMECFILMRIIQGACVGLYTSIVPIVIAEISPIQIMGTTGAFTQIFCSVGTTVAYLFYYILTLALGPENQNLIMYLVFGLPLLTITIQSLILLFVFPYETPKYFLLHHQKSKARDLIALIYKPQYVDEVLNEKIHDLSEALLKEKRLKQSRFGTASIVSEQFPQRMPSRVSVDSALSGIQSQQPETAPVPIFASLHLNTLRQLIGINVVVAYGGNIVKQAIPSLKPIAPIILNFLTLLGAIFSIYLLVKFGRKTILQAGTFIITVTLGFITVGFFILEKAYTPATILIILGLVVYMFTFGATLGSVIWLYIAQICEPSYTILATVITWIFAVIVIVFFPILKKELPNQSPAFLFLFFLVWTGLSFIVNHKVLIETKGKTQIQIQQEFKNIKLCGDLFTKSLQEQVQQKQGPEKPVQSKKQKIPEKKMMGNQDELSAAIINVKTKNVSFNEPDVPDEPIVPPKLDETKF